MFNLQHALFVITYERSGAWKSKSEAVAVLAAQREYYSALAEMGVIVHAGSLGSGNESFVAIVRLKNKAAGLALIADDPAVRSDYLIAKLCPFDLEVAAP